MSYTLGMMGPISTTDFRDFLYPGQWRDDLPKGLGGTPVNLLSCELLKRGHNLIIFSLDPSVQDEVILEGPNLRICIGPFRSRAKHRALDFFAQERKYLLHTIKRENPDMLHAQWTYEYALAAQMSGLPHVITAHDAPIAILRMMFDPYRIIRTLMAYWVLLRAKRVISVSPYVAEHLRSFMLYFGTKEIIPNGMPKSHFEHIKVVRRVEKDTTFATILPGWSRLKNGQVAIEAFALHRKIKPNDKLIMFGHGHGVGQAAEQWAKDNGVADRVEFAGQKPYQRVMERLLNDVDVLVHPSLEEAQPMVLIEAMALSIPVIGGKSSGGVSWTLDNGKAGFLVDVSSSEAVASAMNQLASSAELRNDIGSKGHNLAVNRFHMSVITSKYEIIYSEMFGQCENNLLNNKGSDL
jgi:L-malate glycosyltransferase